METFVILAQVSSIIGWLLLIYSYYKDDIEKLLFIQIISSIFYCLSYFFLGAYSGLLVCFIELLKGIGYYKTDSDNLIFWGTLPVYVLMGIFTFDGIASLLPIIGSVIDGYTLTKNKTIATLGSFFANILWVVYDILILAYMTALTDSVIVVSNLCILLFGYSMILRINRLRFVQSRTFSKNVWNEICKLDTKSYGDDYLWSFDYSKMLVEKDPKSLLLIKYHNNIVGYINYAVLTSEEYMKIIESDNQIKEYNIDNVTMFKKSKKNYLIIDSINIKHEYQNDASMELIIKKIKNIIVSNYNLGYEIESIICPVVNKYEKDIMEKAGFVQHKNYSNNETLYIIDNKTIDKLYLNNVLKRNKFKVFVNEKVTEEMITSIEKLNTKMFGEKHLWNVEHQLELFNKNNKSMIVVTYNDKVVGYLNYLNITKEKFDEMLNSSLTTYNFSIDDIVSFRKRSKHYITINSIVIDKKFQNGYAIRLITRRFKRELTKLYNANYKIDSVGAIAFSEDGKKLFEKLGFVKVRELKNEDVLYLLANDNLNKFLTNNLNGK